MKLTHHGHSCLLVEVAGRRILFDPGTLCEGFEDLGDLDAIVVTHQHADHLDPARIGGLVAANPGALLLADPDTLPLLAEREITATPTSAVRIGEVALEPVGAMHAEIEPTLPRVTNVGVVVRAPGAPSLYHPGDALDGKPGAVDIVAFPLQAPWQRSADMTAFLRRLAPKVAIPIHDGLLRSGGRELYLRFAASYGPEGTELRDLAGQGTVDLWF